MSEKRIIKSFISMVLVCSILSMCVAGSVFAADDQSGETEYVWSENQFTNPGFEKDAVTWDDYIWKSISKYYRVANANQEPTSTLANNVFPYDSTTVHGGNRSLKIVETDTSSYLEISKLKDFRLSDDFRGMYLDGSKKIKFSAWYKNSVNVKGVKLRFRFQSKVTNQNMFVYSEEHYLSGENSSDWEKIETEINMETMVATEGNNTGEKLEPSLMANNEGWWFLELHPISVDDSVICEYYVDDIEINYPKEVEKIVYNYDNMVADETASCSSVAEFIEQAYAGNTGIGREIDDEIYHSGDSSLKITIPGAYNALASFKPTEKFIAGEQYYFSVWYYTNENVNGKRIFLRYATQNNQNISNWVTGTAFDSAVAMTSGKWTKYECRFTATEAMTSGLFTNMYISNELASGTIYFDDFNLRLVPEEVATLVGFSPQDKEENVKLNADICMEFTNPVDPTDIDAEFYVNGEKIDNKDFVCETNGNILIFKPKNGMLPGTEYKFVINRVNDVCGRTVLENTGFAFSTSNKLGLDVKFFDENNSELTKMTTGDITAKFDIENNTGIDMDCIAVIMVCENSRVKKVYATSGLTVPADESLEDIGLTIPDITSSGSYLKVFLWTDATENLRPLSGHIEFR